MPLYEYECGVCGRRFEVIQKFADPPLMACPTCGGAVRKLQSAPAFQLKGTGWYVTDYPKSGQAPVEKNASSEGTDSSGDKDAPKGKSETGDKAGASEKSEKAPITATAEKAEKSGAKDTTSSGPTKEAKTP